MAQVEIYCRSCQHNIHLTVLTANVKEYVIDSKFGCPKCGANNFYAYWREDGETGDVGKLFYHRFLTGEKVKADLIYKYPDGTIQLIEADVSEGR